MSRGDDGSEETASRREFLLRARDLGLRVGLVSAAPVLAVGTLGGCAAPTVNLESALLQKLTTSLMEVGLNFELFNPNSYAIPIEGMAWQIDLFRDPFTNGQVDFRRQIPAQRTVEALVPIAINLQGLLRQIQGLLTQATIPWSIAGQIRFGAAGRAINAPFALDGSWANPLRGGQLPSLPLPGTTTTPDQPRRRRRRR